MVMVQMMPRLVKPRCLETLAKKEISTFEDGADIQGRNRTHTLQVEKNHKLYRKRTVGL